MGKIFAGIGCVVILHPKWHTGSGPDPVAVRKIIGKIPMKSSEFENYMRKMFGNATGTGPALDGYVKGTCISTYFHYLLSRFCSFPECASHAITP